MRSRPARLHYRNRPRIASSAAGSFGRALLAAGLMLLLSACAARRAPSPLDPTAPDPWAEVDRLDAAGQDARAAGHWSEAAAAFEAALVRARPLEEPARTSRLANDAAVAFSHMGLNGRALDLLDEALDARADEGRSADPSILLYNRGYVLWESGRLAEAARDLEAAAEALPPAEAGPVYLDLAEVLLEAEQTDALVDALDRADACLADAPTRERARLTVLRGFSRALAGDLPAALDLLEAGEARWNALGETALAGQAAYNVGTLAADAGDVARARPALLRALAAAEAVSDLPSQDTIRWRLDTLPLP